MKKLWRLFALGMFLGSAYAVEPLPRQVTLDVQTPVGGRPLLHLENHEDFLVLADIHPGIDSSVVFESVRVTLVPGQPMNTPLAFPEGRQLFNAETTLFDPNGRRLRGVYPSAYQALIAAADGSVRLLSFEEAFLSSRHEVTGDSETAEIDLGHFVDSSEVGRFYFDSAETPDDVYVDEFDLPSPLVFADMPLNQLPDLNDPQVIQSADGFPTEDNGAQDPDADVSTFSAAPPDSLVCQPNTDGSDQFTALAPPDNSTSGAGAADGPGNPIIRGRMLLRTIDGGAPFYKAAWGWVVSAWQRVGAWRFLGWAYVSGNGSWQITLRGVNPGLPVLVQYQTKNRFVSIQDARGNPYTWGDFWNLRGADTNIGTRAANLTANGNLPAVDRLYVGATLVWVKFFNTGMNALRNRPIEVTFPNSLASGHCIFTRPDGTRYAWSCSQSADGKIWIVPEHGFASVVQHEIGHSIHSWYWGGTFPPGSGGAHSLTGCFNGGLALTEGFANFLAYWTQFSRTALHPVAQYLGFDVESPNNGACLGPTNETWVASTFWDLYDYWNDGPGGNRFDSLYYVNQAVPVALLLRNRGLNTMPVYLPAVQFGQPLFRQIQFANLFRLNFMIP